FATVFSAHALVVADLDNNGKLDLVVASRSPQQVSVHLGNGNGTFQAQKTFTTSGTGFGTDIVAAADLNGDGKVDLAFSNVDGNSVLLFLGNGNGTFQGVTTFATGTSPRS